MLATYDITLTRGRSLVVYACTQQIKIGFKNLVVQTFKNKIEI